MPTMNLQNNEDQTAIYRYPEKMTSVPSKSFMNDGHRRLGQFVLRETVGSERAWKGSERALEGKSVPDGFDTVQKGACGNLAMPIMDSFTRGRKGNINDPLDTPKPAYTRAAHIFDGYVHQDDDPDVRQEAAELASKVMKLKQPVSSSRCRALLGSYLASQKWSDEARSDIATECCNKVIGEQDGKLDALLRELQKDGAMHQIRLDD
ncbi:hypothetical protein DFS34DRAFT_595504 [Phlyctochytrium arcticum]|nr:hypothetical protein DFS34DRAFT_595504 [Phlyctochytrium arcticum]